MPQITDEMVKRAAIAHYFAELQDAGLPPEDLAGMTPQDAWDEAEGGEQEALKHMRAALEAALLE